MYNEIWDECVKFMNKCIALAKQGLGNTYPNPLVGCVVVHNKQVIGSGWHQKSGGPHAEVQQSVQYPIIPYCLILLCMSI